MGFFDTIKNLTGDKSATASPAPPQPITSRKKVLIVEDDQYLRDFYVELLQRADFDVIKAENGQIGLDMVIAQKPNIILLDLMMPVMDGKTMLQRVRTLPEFAKLPIIVLTNAGDVESMTQTKLYGGANDFLIKSNINPPDIINKIKSLTGI